jgi:formate hydrogenlyase transcriptional activator
VTRRGPAVDEATRYRTLLEINNAIISNLTREALFHAVAEALRRVVPIDRTAVFLHEPARNVLVLFAVESSFPSDYFTVGLEVDADRSHVGLVFRERRPLLRRDLTTEREFPMEERAFADGVRSYAMVPLIARGRSLGALAVASRQPESYGDADVRFLGEAAGQVALAIENMRSYEEIAALKARLERENVYLQEEIHREHDFVEMVGASDGLLAVLAKVEQVAPTDSTVLILGETGTGKELIARAIHDKSTRKARPLVKVNCAAISAGLVESELFGHVKGAFTGAVERRIGRFQLADGGTIFLDEVGELPPETQVKLLRVLQEQEFEPVGSSRTQRVDVRVITATNRNLEALVRNGAFRDDLFYRLNVFPITVPPLRERRRDIPALVMFFLERYARRFGKRVESVSSETMDRLVRYAWPGNVRELQNLVERAVILARGPVLALDRDVLLAAADGEDPAVTPETATTEPTASSSASGRSAATGKAPAAGLDTLLEDVERRHIVAALEHARWVIDGPQGAARTLSIHPNTLRSRMRKLGIRRAPHEIS